MATNDKISLKHGYMLHFNEDGTFFLKVETKEDTFEFDGTKNGNIIDASSFEDEGEEYRDTLDNLYETAMNFFNECGIDEDTAMSICDALTPWFEEHAISEEEATLKRIEELKTWIDCRRKCIDERNKWIAEEREQIAKRIAESDVRINQRKEEIFSFKADIHRLAQQIADLKASLNKSRFVSVEPEYTGGGIYLFTGRLADGNFFMADTANYDVRVLTEDPNEPTGMDALGITERNIDSVEWQEEHLVKDLTPDEAVEFFKEMLKWVEDNDPSGNYLGSDMDYFKEELETLHGDWR